MIKKIKQYIIWTNKHELKSIKHWTYCEMFSTKIYILLKKKIASQSAQQSWYIFIIHLKNLSIIPLYSLFASLSMTKTFWTILDIFVLRSLISRKVSCLLCGQQIVVKATSILATSDLHCQEDLFYRVYANLMLFLHAQVKYFPRQSSFTMKR